MGSGGIPGGRDVERTGGVGGTGMARYQEGDTHGGDEGERSGI